MLDISDIRSDARNHILHELRASYDDSIAPEKSAYTGYWRSHRSSIALLVVESLNARYANRLKAIFEIQDFHNASADALFRLYAESELDVINSVKEEHTVANSAIHEAVVASYITRMQIADYIIQSAPLTDIVYFCSELKFYKALPEYMLVTLNAAREIGGIQTPEQMLSELRELILDMSNRHYAQKTDVYFALSKVKHLNGVLVPAV